VKVALTEPLLPSVTVASLMRIDGCGVAPQTPSLSRTERLLDPRFCYRDVGPAVAVEVPDGHARGRCARPRTRPANRRVASPLPSATLTPLTLASTAMASSFPSTFQVGRRKCAIGTVR
jgi:hypothetical protein